MPQPPGPRRFKTLSEAVLAGCLVAPLPERALGDRAGGRPGRGALQAAWLAQFPDETAPPGRYISEDLAQVYGELSNDMGPSCPRGPNTSCPSWPSQSKRTLEQAVIHLEDVHRLGREEIARWLVAHGF